jgi:hypothetical protein
MNAFGCRLLYALFANRLVIALAAGALALTTRVLGEVRAEGLLSAFERRYVFSGWPHHSRGWINLHMSRFVWRVRRHTARRHPAVLLKSVAANRARLRVGCVGRFRGLLSFPKALFDAFPREADLHLFDLEYEGRYAEYLAGATPRYVPIGPLDVQKAAQAINAADLDVLVNANTKRDAYDLLDRIETPCIVNFCPGSDLVHHDRVAVQMNGQPQADYFITGRRLFCGTTRRIFGDDHVYPVRGYYDPRDMSGERLARWAERQPLIVFHGSLYKLSHEPLLECLFALMAADSSLEFVFMGKDSMDALARIDRAAKRFSVAPRVHYEGAFDASRSSRGTIEDTGWSKLRGFLAAARLAPDPWPVGGASARFEAFAMGAPSVHMAVRFDEASWGRPQPGIIEVPHMLIPEAAATTVDEYRAICDRCLHDEQFADALATEQLRIARELSDPDRLWQQIFDGYQEWLVATGKSTTAAATVLQAIGQRIATESVHTQAS